jgi:transmembrane sensor
VENQKSSVFITEMYNIKMQSGIDTIIRKVLMAEANEKEKISLDQWLHASPENQIIFQKLQDAWNEKSAGREIINQDEVFEKKVWNRGVEGMKFRVARKKQFDLNYFLKVAATILIILVPSYFMGNYVIKNNKTVIAPVLSKIIVKESPKGQKLRTFLPDGSTVWLNSESSIKFQENFNDSIRFVELQGEGYFEVIKDNTRPFIVKTGEIKTTALGTSFNINAYPNDNTIEIALITGKVKVNTLAETDKIFYLEPNSAIAFIKPQNEFTEFNFIPHNVLAWKDGVLLFKDDSFQTVVNKLERWYGIEITVVGNPPANWSLTGRFTNNHLVETLEAVKFGRQFDYTLDNKNLEIKF